MMKNGLFQGGGKSKNHLEQRLKQLRCKALSALHTATDPKRHWSGLWDTGVPEKEYKTFVFSFFRLFASFLLFEHVFLCYVRWLLNSLTRFCTDVDLISHKTEDAGTLAKAVGNVVIMGDISQGKKECFSLFWLKFLTSNSPSRRFLENDDESVSTQ
jgi:hypothetical protein